MYYIYINIHMYIHTQQQTSDVLGGASTVVCTYIYIYTYIHMYYIYIYIRMYTYIYTNSTELAAFWEAHPQWYVRLGTKLLIESELGSRSR